MDTTTELYSISGDLSNELKAMKKYSTSSATKTIENMLKKSKGGASIHYDENTNPFVQLYRWFAGTPWENFEERLEKYGITLKDIAKHLDKNSDKFITDKESIAEMTKVLAEMGPILEENETATERTKKAADKAKKDIETILKAHLEQIAKDKAKLDETHALEAKTLELKQEEKDRIRAKKAADKQDRIVEARTVKARGKHDAQAKKMTQ